ncbi:hypothetical protein CK203_070420 [Vitis vinifera]|uniref:Malectin-like domain-containing protein n=1 Tax=Vitis vinifera TaxID=29760 RepID=A0A438FAL3_VITVI|nr:hypothetical protein CK203_070420 [Vitis vinifera]
MKVEAFISSPSPSPFLPQCYSLGSHHGQPPYLNSFSPFYPVLEPRSDEGWIGDEAYIQNGESKRVQSGNSVSQVMDTLRVFSSRNKNCYSLLKYIVLWALAQGPVRLLV